MYGFLKSDVIVVKLPSIVAVQALLELIKFRKVTELVTN